LPGVNGSSAIAGSAKQLAMLIKNKCVILFEGIALTFLT
jgi:hypothetical protein